MAADESNPWKIKYSKPIYENPWIKVREDQVVNPAGKDGIYGVVSFKNKAIGIVPIDSHGNVILVGQYRYPLEEYSWEIPEGGSPIASEDPLETAKRELKEETGFSAKKWTKIGKIHTSNSVTDEEGFIYLAQDLIAGESEWEDTEVLKIKTIPLEEAIQDVLDLKITDGITIAGLMIAQKYVQSEN